MSKKLSIKKQLSDLKSKMAELNKQLKREEDAEKMKVGEMVIGMFKSGKINLESLEIELRKTLGDGDEEVEEKQEQRSFKDDSQNRSISNEDR